MFLNLKVCILQSGIRQNRLAQAVKIDEAVLSKIINGFREPTLVQRKSIAAFLQQDETWLFQHFKLPTRSAETDDGQRHNLTGNLQN
jgi:transcriptional regulator with XRE-family HTH domain